MPAGAKRAPAGHPKLPCPFPGCIETVKSRKGLTYHVNSEHRNPNAIRGAPGATAGAGHPSPSPPPSPIDLDDGGSNTPPPGPSPPPGLPPRAEKIYHPFLSGAPEINYQKIPEADQMHVQVDRATRTVDFCQMIHHRLHEQ